MNDTLREIGTIKWFGHRRPDAGGRNYGYVVRDDGAEIRVDRIDFEGAPDAVAEGVYVTYKAALERPSRTIAKEVRFLYNESDPAVLEKAVFDGALAARAQALPHLLQRLGAEQAAKCVLSLMRSEVEPLTWNETRSKVPLEILLDRELLAALPDDAFFETVCRAKEPATMVASGAVDDVLKRLGNMFETGSHFPGPLPEWLHVRREWAAWLPDEDQVELFIENVEGNAADVWTRIRPEARVLCLFRTAKEGGRWYRGEQFGHEEDVRVGLLRALMDASWTNRQAAADAFHRSLVAHLLDYTTKSDDLLELHPLLPHCGRQPEVWDRLAKGLVDEMDCVALEETVWLCEGRRSRGKQKDATDEAAPQEVYCPRVRGRCEIIRSVESGIGIVRSLGHARTEADVSLHWREWSLAEVFAKLKVEPQVRRMRPGESYVTSLGGCVNRYNEIRNRMRCRKCHCAMRFDEAYAFNLAAYNKTVASCSRGCEGNVGVYLNHCWGCERIIDSRDSTVLWPPQGVAIALNRNRLYLCRSCGAGPKGIGYKPGDVCPSCGGIGSLRQTSELRWQSGGRRVEFSCLDCHHGFISDPDKISLHS